MNLVIDCRDRTGGATTRSREMRKFRRLTKRRLLRRWGWWVVVRRCDEIGLKMGMDMGSEGH